MRVYVIRHGQSVANLEHRYAGWSQVPLSELGRQQAVEAGKWLQTQSIDKVYCSDLCRARETCELALPACEPVTSALLREVNVGCLGGRTSAECREVYGEALEQHNRDQDFSAYGGESHHQVQQRVNAFIAQLEQTEGGNVAVFGHEGTLLCFMSRVLGFEIGVRTLRTPNTCVAEFEYLNGTWKLRSWNSTGL